MHAIVCAFARQFLVLPPYQRKGHGRTLARVRARERAAPEARPAAHRLWIHAREDDSHPSPRSAPRRAAERLYTFIMDEALAKADVSDLASAYLSVLGWGAGMGKGCTARLTLGAVCGGRAHDPPSSLLVSGHSRGARRRVPDHA